MSDHEHDPEVIPARAKALGKKVSFCHTADCRVLTYIRHGDEKACPDCGGIGSPMAELRDVGTPLGGNRA